MRAIIHLMHWTKKSTLPKYTVEDWDVCCRIYTIILNYWAMPDRFPQIKKSCRLKERKRVLFNCFLKFDIFFLNCGEVSKVWLNTGPKDKTSNFPNCFKWNDLKQIRIKFKIHVFSSFHPPTFDHIFIKLKGAPIEDV